MAKPLTVKAIENLHPGPARREIPDGAVPGLYLVVQPNGKTSGRIGTEFMGAHASLLLDLPLGST